MPRRSVFGNYAPASTPDSTIEAFVPNGTVPGHKPVPATAAGHTGLQESIDLAVARSFVYHFLTRAFEDPVKDTWSYLTDARTHHALHTAVRVMEKNSRTLEKSALALTERLRPEGFESYQLAYVSAFGHAARGVCPLNEIEYGDLKADPLFQPHRLADLAAFYRAFGLELADEAGERPDHIGMELEFMSILSAKEA